MRVDFYHLTRDPAPQAIAEIAPKALARDLRMLIVSGHAEQRDAVSQALWNAPGFLAHGEAGGAADARQPLLLSDRVDAANGAQIVGFADGEWREADGFDRAMLFFDESAIEAARDTWRSLKSRDGVERHYWKQEEGGWREMG